MKKLLLFIYGAILPALAFSQYQSKEFTLDDSDVTTSVALGVLVSNADSVIVLHNASRASGLFVSGCANLANDDESYVRITLKDTDCNEYLIYELYPILAESRQCPFSKIGLETAYLDNIQAQSIRIETLNASVTLDSVYYVVPERSSRNMSKAIPNRKAQCEHIANKLNERLISGNKTWRAGVTFVSQMTFEEKKWLMGKKAPVLYGFDYYKGGIFVMPGFSRYVSQNANTRSSDNYVTEWDWRNRHGKNWVTSVKDQDTCASCWAFSALGAFESYINLYYNQLLNLDLSEQEIISLYVNNSNCDGGYITDALNHICSLGAIYESDFPYVASNAPYNPAIDIYDNLKLGNYSGDYYISYKDYHSKSYIEEEDSIKRMLFKSPITFGIDPWWHYAVLVGYKQIQSGEYCFTSESDSITVTISQDNPLVGHPAWLIKNSTGTTWGQNGFGYVAISLSDVYGIHKLFGNVTSQILTDHDIVCEDADGDGYYNWGIKDSTFTLPAWAPTEEDGDDSDCTKGPINAFGKLQDTILPETMILDSNDGNAFSNPPYQYIQQHIKICNSAEVTITGHLFCCRGVSITIESGSTLYVEGEINNVILKPEPGSQIIIENGGRIKHNKDVNFRIPIGVKFEQNYGTIE